jgi:hypothetical protein
LEHDLDVIRAKMDAGATRGISQFFLEADTFLRFRDRLVASGIDLPVSPGIMPVTNFTGLKRMAAGCGAAGEPFASQGAGPCAGGGELPVNGWWCSDWPAAPAGGLYGAAPCCTSP